MDHNNLIYEISSLRRSADDAERTGKGWKEVWDHIKNIGKAFKETHFPNKDDKNAAWVDFQSIVDRIKMVQERQRKDGDRRLAILESKISQLENQLPGSFWGSSGKPDWKKLWDQIKEIQQQFRELGYVDKEKREALWKRFEKTINNVKSTQETERKERQKLSDKSTSYKEEIIRLAEMARPSSSNIIVDVIETIAKTSITISTAGLINFDDLKEEKYELQERSKRLKEAWDCFNKRKEQILPEDRHHAWEKLQQVGEELNAAWDRWKHANQKRHEAAQLAYEERKRRHEEYQSRLRDRIDRKKTQIGNLQNILYKKKTHLSELQYKRSEARSDSFRDRVSGWINEELSNITDIEGKIRGIEAEIEDLRRKLD